MPFFLDRLQPVVMRHLGVGANALPAQAGLHDLGLYGQLQRMLQTPDRIVRIVRREHTGGQAVATVVWCQQQPGHLMPESVGRAMPAAAERKQHYPRQPGRQAQREIAQNAVQGLLDPVQGIAAAPVQQRQILLGAAVVGKALEHR